MKIILAIMLVILTVFLTGCNNTLSEGKVIAKTFHPAYTRVWLMPVHIGKITSFIPMYIHYDERFVFTLRYFDSNDNKTEGDIYTTKEIYDSVNIGDYYIANWKLDSSEPKKIERKATEDEKQKYGVD